MYIVKFDKWLDNENFVVSDQSKRINFYVNIDGKIIPRYNAINEEEENRLIELVKMYTIE